MFWFNLVDQLVKLVLWEFLVGFFRGLGLCVSSFWCFVPVLFLFCFGLLFLFWSGFVFRCLVMFLFVFCLCCVVCVLLVLSCPWGPVLFLLFWWCLLGLFLCLCPVCGLVDIFEFLFRKKRWYGLDIMLVTQSIKAWAWHEGRQACMIGSLLMRISSQGLEEGQGKDTSIYKRQGSSRAPD